MIEFIQDYTTKALPPETFKDGDQVERSNESELYFVRLGVAGFVHDGKLVGEDFQPIERKQTVLVVTTDRRFADTGRGGEVIGLDAPQRASTGPGNEVVFSGQPDSTSLSAVEIDQLRGDLATSVTQLEEHRTTTANQIEELTSDLTTAQGARETALADLTSAQGERDRALADLTTAQAERDQALSDLNELREQHDKVTGDYATLRQAADADASRIAELEQQLEAAKAPADGVAKHGKAK
jgi:hypothetical protein